MMTNEMKWSDSQNAVFDWGVNGTGNAIITAVAGAGKTTTLVEFIRRMQAVNSNTRIAICAYNKKMGEELKARTAGIPNVNAGTLHSFGFAALRRTGKKYNIEANKVRNIVGEMVIREPRMRPAAAFISKLVGLAKEVGVGFFSDINDTQAWLDLIDHHDLTIENDLDLSREELVSFAAAVLRASNADRENIDFADMILHTLVHNMKTDQYDIVLIDEAQDTNPTRRALAAKMLKVGGRLVAVGDPHQAIFGFTGADNNSLDQIAEKFNAIKLPLTVSYRCAQAVVNHARKWVSHIEAAPTAPEGSVTSLAYEKLLEQSATLTPSDAILCRNTAPLVDLAFTLIRRGTPCRIEGRDIGQQLIALVRKYKVRSLADLTRRMADYRERETQKALSKGAEAKADQINDRIDTIMVLIERAAELKYDIDGLVNMITGMFGDSEKEAKKLLTLSTIHKAKGLEWQRVFLLGRQQLQPSRFARQAWQMAQEVNLIYVAITRAKLDLVEVTDIPKR